MTTVTHATGARPAGKRPASGRTSGASTAEAVRDRADSDRRLAALGDDLARRDDAARRRRDARRPALWLSGMTVGAVVLALLAIAVMVAPPL